MTAARIQYELTPKLVDQSLSNQIVRLRLIIYFFVLFGLGPLVFVIGATGLRANGIPSPLLMVGLLLAMGLLWIAGVVALVQRGVIQRRRVREYLAAVSDMPMDLSLAESGITWHRADGDVRIAWDDVLPGKYGSVWRLDLEDRLAASLGLPRSTPWLIVPRDHLDLVAAELLERADRGEFDDEGEKLPPARGS